MASVQNLIKLSPNRNGGQEKTTRCRGNLCNKIELNMSTTILQPSVSPRYKSANKTASTSLFRKFITWCEHQQENRLLWVGIVLAAHGCILTPITVMAVLLAGTSLILFLMALVAMGLALVTNLAAMPTRYTIPVFLLSIVMDIAIIIASLALGMDITKTYI
jgi:hypothetical protein